MSEGQRQRKTENHKKRMRGGRGARGTKENEGDGEMKSQPESKRERGRGREGGREGGSEGEGGRTGGRERKEE